MLAAFAALFLAAGPDPLAESFWRLLDARATEAEAEIAASCDLGCGARTATTVRLRSAARASQSGDHEAAFRYLRSADAERLPDTPRIGILPLLAPAALLTGDDDAARRYEAINRITMLLETGQLLCDERPFYGDQADPGRTEAYAWVLEVDGSLASAFGLDERANASLRFCQPDMRVGLVVRHTDTMSAQRLEDALNEGVRRRTAP